MWQIKNYPKHLYIHWPFCKSKCHFCDFVSFQQHEEYQLMYHQALLQEIKLFALQFPSDANRLIISIYLGGGTPSLYPLNLLEELFCVLKNLFDLSSANEITLEVNPVGITHEMLDLWKKVGINRLSIGLQVLDDKVLANLNRHQRCFDVKQLFEFASDYFSNLSADLILGLPGISESVWQQTLDYVASQPLKHISVYLLMLHEKTKLYFNVRRGLEKLPGEEQVLSQFEDTVSYLASKQFYQYELSNFAKSGYESIHNQAYWDRIPYKGFGLGAASFDGVYRYKNIKNLSSYLGIYGKSDNSTIKSSVLFSEKLSKKQHLLEELMLNLRRNKGVALHRMLYSLKKAEKLAIQLKLEILKERCLIEKDGEKFFLTLKGMMLESEIVAYLI